MPTSGGKKQSHRTKGNVKPSSSSQAAELLVSQGTGSTSGFIGFGQGPKYVPASETSDDIDSSLDSDFRMVLRKLTKRDSTTKIKSLQELSEICGTKEEESIKSVLPFWPRIYNKMTLDLDYRVREAAQHVMSALVKKAGRNVAPYLKNMMGAWLLNQCDTYPTVASAALSAFSNSFSPHKQKDAWSFSKDTILEYLSDNILKQTPQTLSDPKATSPEDMESKYVRVVTCSLLAVRKLLQCLPADQAATLTVQLKTLLEDHKFWKHGKHKVSMVKGAMYGCISGLCQSQPELCENYVSKMAPLVLHNLDEKDPVICGNLWEAALSLVNYLPTCWEHINVQKGFMPKLKVILENGCHGNAVVIGPSLLPFISKVPPDLLSDSDKFFQDFFTHFKTGLSSSSLQTNRSECNALVRAYMECANYVVLRETAPSTFLCDQVLPLVESSLLEIKSQLHKTPLYNMVSQLLGPATKCDTIPGTAEFWNQLAGTLLDALDTTDTDTEDHSRLETRGTICDRMLSFVRALYYPDLELNKKSGKVTFKTDDDTDRSFNDMKLEDTGQKAELGKHATEFVHKMVQQTFKSAYGNSNSDSLKLLCEILKLNSCDDIVSKIVQCEKGDSNLSGKDISDVTSEVFENENNSSTAVKNVKTDIEVRLPTEHFVFDVCMNWLRQLQKQGRPSADLNNVINLVSLFMNKLDRQKIEQLLEELNEILTDMEGFTILLANVLDLSKTVLVVREWVKGPVLGSRLVSLTRELCSGRLEKEGQSATRGWEMVSTALSVREAGGMREAGGLLISRGTADSLLQLMGETLSQLNWASNRIKTEVYKIAAAVMKYFQDKTCLESPAAADLLLQLFSISVTNNKYITGETRELLLSVWSSGFSLTFQDTENTVRAAETWTKAADIVTSFVNKSVHSVDVLDDVLFSVKDLLDVILTSCDSSDVMTVAHQLFVEISTQVPNAILEYLCVRGDYPAVPKKGPPCVSWTRTLYTTLYNTRLLELTRSLGGASDPESEGADVFWGQEALEYLLICYQGLAVVEMSIDAGEQESQSDDREAAKKLKSALLALVARLDTHGAGTLLELVLAGCNREPDYCLCVGTVLAALNSRSDVPLTVELSHISERCSNLLPSCHYLVHSSLPYLTSADLFTLTQLLTAMVLSSSPDQDVLSSSAGILCLISQCVAMVTDQYETEAREMLQGTLDQILVVKEFLYNSDLSQSTDTEILMNTDIARFLCSVVKLIPETLSDKHWDFVMCSLASWLQSLNESKSSLLKSTAEKSFTVSICDLVVQVSKCMETIKPDRGFPENLATEWTEFFSDSIFDVVLPLYVEICGALKSQTTSTNCVLLTAICSAASYTPKSRLLEHLAIDDTSCLPDELQTLVNHVGGLMLYKNRATQISAWHILNRIIGDLPQYDKEGSSEEIATDHQEPTARGPPLFLLKVLDDCSEALHSLLEDSEIDRHTTVKPEDAVYHHTLAYLLSWQLIVNFFTSGPAQIRQEYARYLEEHHLVAILMWCLYKLMPANPDKMFDYVPDMTVSDSASSTEIQHIACNLYKLGLKNMPAMVRNWWKNCDRKTSAYVDKFTTKNVSNILGIQEIQSVQSTGKELDGMTVKTRTATREVIATYCLNEVTIEMVITLSPNYPLGPISVKSEKRVGVTAQQWEKWLLQLNIFLQHQNGNIIDGLELWKNNIDKKFEGVDDCMICFSVLHGTNFQLPRITCKTCKKKFHSACLYKWFNTSHNSTCPLCRNVF